MISVQKYLEHIKNAMFTTVLLNAENKYLPKNNQITENN